jgi:hypothetical protein
MGSGFCVASVGTDKRIIKGCGEARGHQAHPALLVCCLQQAWLVAGRRSSSHQAHLLTLHRTPVGRNQNPQLARWWISRPGSRTTQISCPRHTPWRFAQHPGPLSPKQAHLAPLAVLAQSSRFPPKSCCAPCPAARPASFVAFFHYSTQPRTCSYSAIVLRTVVSPSLLSSLASIAAGRRVTNEGRIIKSLGKVRANCQLGTRKTRATRLPSRTLAEQPKRSSPFIRFTTTVTQFHLRPLLRLLTAI